LLHVATGDANTGAISLGPGIPLTILGAQFDRAGFGRLNFESLQPSAAVESFLHRMSFNRSSGFQVIEPLRSAMVVRSGIAPASPSPQLSSSREDGAASGETDRAGEDVNVQTDQGHTPRIAPITAYDTAR
jgi:hypothetical protein